MGATKFITVMDYKIPLFDIDGTLLSSGNPVHVASYASAINTIFASLHLKPDEIRIHERQGMIDNQILLALLSEHGVPSDLAQECLPALVKVMERYFIQHVGVTPAETIMPGVEPLLFELRRAGFPLSILSGNIQIIGCTRLYRAELFSEMCAIGAYGDMASTRAELVPVAIEHLEHKLKMRIRPSDVVVIGDTVKDIECAREAGVSVIAVATGGSTYEKLEAAQPDLLVMDFVSGHDAVMAYLKK